MLIYVAEVHLMLLKQLIKTIIIYWLISLIDLFIRPTLLTLLALFLADYNQDQLKLHVAHMALLD